MTLAEFLAAPLPDTATLRTLGVVMPTEIAQRMVNLHAWYGDPRCTVFPAGLDDGRWVHCADILPDCLTPGGTYSQGFAHVDPAAFTSIDVVPLADLTIADPQPPQLTPEPQPEPPNPET